MAEFCKECFKRKLTVPSDGITDEMLVVSEDVDFCEGCGEWKPVVLYVNWADRGDVDAENVNSED